MSVHIHNLRSLSWSTINRPADHMQSCSVLFFVLFLPCFSIPTLFAYSNQSGFGANTLNPILDKYNIKVQ